jgi:predicted nucleic acid-binding protein
MGKIHRKALIVTPAKRLKIIKEDEPDNRVLECAIKANADFIITGNKRHFSFEEFKGSKIVTPREFINSISELWKTKERQTYRTTVINFEVNLLVADKD